MPDDIRTGVFLDTDSLDNDDVDLRPIKASLPEWTFYRETSPDQVDQRIGNAQIIITNKVEIGAGNIASAKRLQLICIAATGTNNVDIKAATGRGITICNVTDYCTHSVVEHVFSLILALSRNLVGYGDLIQQGVWQRSRQFGLLNLPISELSGKTLGIVGYGILGKAVAEAARCFGMNVLVAQRPGTKTPLPGRLPLPELLTNSDIITLHCPLTSGTKNLIGKRELSLMKNDSIIINTARGGMVDEAALQHALQNGEIGGAGIDVLETEPPNADSPLLDARLPNLILTPHIAWASRSARQNLVDKVSNNIAAYLRGEPVNRVTE